MSNKIAAWFHCPEVTITKRYGFKKLKSAPENSKIEETIKGLIDNKDIDLKIGLGEDEENLIKKKTKCSCKSTAVFIDASENPDFLVYQGDEEGFYEDDESTIVIRTPLQKMPVQSETDSVLTEWDVVIECKQKAYITQCIKTAFPERLTVKRYVTNEGCTLPQVWAFNNSPSSSHMELQDVKEFSIIFKD